MKKQSFVLMLVLLSQTTLASDTGLFFPKGPHTSVGAYERFKKSFDEASEPIGLKDIASIPLSPPTPNYPYHCEFSFNLKPDEATQSYVGTITDGFPRGAGTVVIGQLAMDQAESTAIVSARCKRNRDLDPTTSFDSKFCFEFNSAFLKWRIKKSREALLAASRSEFLPTQINTYVETSEFYRNSPRENIDTPLDPLAGDLPGPLTTEIRKSDAGLHIHTKGNEPQTTGVEYYGECKPKISAHATDKHWMNKQRNQL